MHGGMLTVIHLSYLDMPDILLSWQFLPTPPSYPSSEIIPCSCQWQLRTSSMLRSSNRFSQLEPEISYITDYYDFSARNSKKGQDF